MKADIDTLIEVTFDVDRNFRSLQFLAGLLPGRRLEPFQISPNDIVGFRHWHALGELSCVIRKSFPPGFFLVFIVRPPDLHRHAVNRTAIGIPDGSKDQRVWRRFRLRFLAARGPISRNAQRHQKHQRQNDHRQKQGQQPPREREMSGGLQSSSSDSSLTVSFSSSSSSSSSPTFFSSTGLTVITSKSAPHS